MTVPVSHKLHVRPDGQMFVLSGNPTIGYQCHHVTLDHVSDHKRSWQAMQAAGEWPGAGPEPCLSVSTDGERCVQDQGHRGPHYTYIANGTTSWGFQ